MVLLQCLGRIIHRFLCKLFNCEKCQGDQGGSGYFGWAVETTDSFKFFTEDLNMQLNNEQRARVTIKPKTAGGNDARIDGAVSFTSDNPDVLRVETVDDLNAYIYGVSVGTTRVVATFDADLGDGVRTLEFDGDVTVVEAEAVSVSGEFGEPELVLTPVGEPPVENPPAEEPPAEEPPAEEPPAEEPPAEEPPAEEPPAEEPPAEEPPAEEPPTEEPPTEEPPAP